VQLTVDVVLSALATLVAFNAAVVVRTTANAGQLAATTLLRKLLNPSWPAGRLILNAPARVR
jgi:hypothetical protein